MINKKQIIKIIKETDFLTIADKKEWLKIVDIADVHELNEIHDFFVKAEKAQNNKKLKIIYKAGLGDRYKKKIKSLSDKLIKTAIKKQEIHDKQGENAPDKILKKLENPENILKALDEI